MKNRNLLPPQIYWIDLFCGAGGTTTGIHLADANATVAACVNHCAKAIESHKANHPDCLHITEDIKNFKVVQHLAVLVKNLRSKNPDCIINIWASLECTNYSKAKGGLPRDADSRTLAEHLFMYLENLNPDYLYIENVREFMAWGPLCENGRPISRKNGRDYIKWVNKVQSYGFKYDYKLLNAADFGAYTSRERYFGIFAKHGMPISFPQPTHVKELPKEGGMFVNEKKQWKPVKEVLQLDEKGKSIFERKKPLSENTLKRIYAGLIKFVAGGENEFIKKYYSGRPAGKVISVNGPAGTITTIDGQALVSTEWMMNPNFNNVGSSLDQPSPTVLACRKHHYLMKSEFLTSYYGNGQAHDSDQPCPTVTTKDRFAVNYLMYNYTNGGKGNHSSVDTVAGSVTTTPKHNLVTNEWLTDTQFKRVGQDVEKPCFTLIARMDKKPPYLVQTQDGHTTIAIYSDDTPFAIKIKEFMALYGIVDIKMRMLSIPELKAIQGFPKDYILKGTKTDQKRFIGNSVETTVAKCLVESNYNALCNHLNVAI